jgi:hypothetical protein
MMLFSRSAGSCDHSQAHGSKAHGDNVTMASGELKTAIGT